MFVLNKEAGTNRDAVTYYSKVTELVEDLEGVAQFFFDLDLDYFTEARADGTFEHDVSEVQTVLGRHTALMGPVRERCVGLTIACEPKYFGSFTKSAEVLRALQDEWFGKVHDILAGCKWAPVDRISPSRQSASQDGQPIAETTLLDQSSPPPSSPSRHAGTQPEPTDACPVATPGRNDAPS